MDTKNNGTGFFDRVVSAAKSLHPPVWMVLGVPLAIVLLIVLLVAGSNDTGEGPIVEILFLVVLSFMYSGLAMLLVLFRMAKSAFLFILKSNKDNERIPADKPFEIINLILTLSFIIGVALLQTAPYPYNSVEYILISAICVGFLGYIVQFAKLFKR